MKISLVQVVTTVATEENAERIAQKAMENKLAACAQVSGPITSYFKWNNKNCVEGEWVCTLKTTNVLSAGLMALIQENHTYETPEIIVTPILQVSPEYLKWVIDSVKKGK